MKPFIIILFAFISFSIKAQTKVDTIIYAEHVRKFLHKGSFHNFNELKSVFYEFEDSKMAYDKDFKRSSNNAILFTLGLASTVIWAPILADNECPPGEDCASVVTTLLSIANIGACLGGLFANISNKTQSRPGIIETYNAHFRDELGMNKREINLNLKLSGTAVGLIMNF